MQIGYTHFTPWTSLAGGLLVGIGTRYGPCCTSGHGICGLSRRSPRSIAATAAFMATGFLTVWLLRHLEPIPVGRRKLAAMHGWQEQGARRPHG